MKKHLSNEALVAYLEEGLAPKEVASVERHLEGCSACRTDLESIKRMVSVLEDRLGSSRATTVPSPELRTKVDQILLGQIEVHKPWWRTRKAVLALGFATVTLVALLVLFWQLPRQDTQGSNLGAAITQMFMIEQPRHGDILHGSPVEVTGTVERGVSLAINEQRVSVDSSGRFRVKVLLEVGENAILIVGVTSEGRREERTLTVNYEPP